MRSDSVEEEIKEIQEILEALDKECGLTAQRKKL